MLFTSEQATAIKTACASAITVLATDAVKSVTINGKSYTKFDISQILDLMRICDESINTGTVQGRAILLCDCRRPRT